MLFVKFQFKGNKVCVLSLGKFSCSFCTEIDIPTLKNQARYPSLNSVFDSFIGSAFWLEPADPTHCSCSCSLIAAYKINETRKLLTFLKRFI